LANTPPVVTTELTPGKTDAQETVAQTAKTNEQVQEEQIQDLTKLQTSDAFKSLPQKIQKNIQRILSLEDKDNKMDNNIDHTTKEVEDISQKINTLTNDNSIKQKRIDTIVIDRNQMKEINALKAKVKELDSEKQNLNREIRTNNVQITELNTSLTNKKAYLTELTRGDTRRTDKMEDKLATVVALLEEEKTQKTTDLNAIQGLHTSTNLATEIASLQKDIANLVDVQTKIVALQT
jgi:chromosome segregation ATPase